ncbi:MAG: CoA-binding protein [Bacteroidetes bacterium]|nr:CoA-binding protein [Bacteroidota bacterium]
MKKTLVIGASTNPQRYSYIATNLLSEYNHEVIPFGNKMGFIEEHQIVTNFPKSTDFDTVTLYLNESLQKEYYEKIIALKPRRVIFNPGTENHTFMEMLNKEGIQTLEACTLVMLRTNQF